MLIRVLLRDINSCVSALIAAQRLPPILKFPTAGEHHENQYSFIHLSAMDPTRSEQLEQTKAGIRDLVREQVVLQDLSARGVQPLQLESEHQPVEEPILKYDNLWGLRWPVFCNITDIQVLEDARDVNSERKSFQSTTPDGFHPIAFEPATNPPQSKLRISIGEVGNMSFWEERSEGLEAPDDLLVVAEEGERFIAVLDFVRQVGDWLQTNREKIEILLLESVVPENLYFGGFSPTWPETLEGGESVFAVSINVLEDQSVTWENLAFLAGARVETRVESAGEESMEYFDALRQIKEQNRQRGEGIHFV
jgi:hypothetical protein